MKAIARRRGTAQFGTKLDKFQAFNEYHQKVKVPISPLCQIVKMSRSGYYDWLNHAPSQQAQENEWWMTEIKLVFVLYNGIFDYRRIQIHINR